jgi:hypothetical protein
MDRIHQVIREIVSRQQKTERRLSDQSSVEPLAQKDLCHNRRFCTAAGGFVGVGPRPLQTGDLITILYGAQWPIILRRFETGYHLLGRCLFLVLCMEKLSVNIEAKVFQTSCLCSIDIRTVASEKLVWPSNQEFHMRGSICNWFERIWRVLESGNHSSTCLDCL